VLSVKELERITQTRYGTDAYNLALLVLRNRILTECKDRGNHFTVVRIKGALHVLTDEQAAVYNADTFRAGIKKMKVSFKRLGQVDQIGLSEEQKRQHERSLFVCGKVLQSVQSTRKELRGEAHQRTTPGLPAPKVKE
jgi:hypothetical protein